MDIPKIISNTLLRKTTLTKIVNEFTIFIDSSFMMTDEADDFFIKELTPLLIKKSKKIILAQKVFDELFKQAKPNNKIKTKSQISKAQKGLDIISYLVEKDCLRLLGSDTDTYADNLFVAKFTEKRLNMKLCLLTQDNALGEEIIGLNTSKSSGVDKNGKNRIKGIKAFKFNGAGKIEEFTSEKVNNNLITNPKPIKKFSNSAKLVDLSKSEIISVVTIPSNGDKVFDKSGKSIMLGQEIGNGAEGIVYSVDDDSVCKIYKEDKFTNLSHEKLKLMIGKQITNQSICWPSDIIYDESNNPVGYLMKKAEGVELHKRLFFGPKLIEARLPSWTKVDLVKVCLNILDAIRVLHLSNVLIGDLNGRNIMVCEDCSIYIVDTDSFQLEGYPCPMGQIAFTPPEIQKKKFNTFLRTTGHENFAIATLIFMILMPGKPPYAKVDGGMITDNIRKAAFSYPYNKNLPKDPPKGPWRFMWSHLPSKTKKLFYETFEEGVRFDCREWLDALKSYEYELEKGYHSSDIKPNDYKRLSDYAASTYF